MIVLETVVMSGLASGMLMVGNPSASATTAPACVGYYGLTFDDGPSPMTQQYLDTLKSKNARATFFVIGYNIKANPGVVEKEAAAGQQVGNHTQDHLSLLKVDATTFNTQIDSVTKQLRALGIHAPLLRPPYGDTNASVRQRIEAKGMLQTMWSVDTLDWQAGATTDSIVAKAMTVKNGGIILMHDNHPKTLAAVPQIIDQLKAKGMCTGRIIKSSTEQPTTSRWLTMNVMAVRP